MKHIILASASVLAMIAVPAYAQTGAGSAQDAAPSSDASEDEAGLKEIVVTAQRVQESAQKVPVAITVVRPEELVRQNITRAEDLARIVPALVATSSGGANTTFFIRGVGNTTVNSYSDPAISFNYDGVYIGRPNSTQGFFFDLQRVEVLKGPQGTLYGRNATGGAINVIPQRPVIGETSGYAQASYGNYDATQGQGALNLPIGENGAFRISGSFNKHDGYLSDGTGDADQYSIRAQVLAELTPNLTTRIAADVTHQGGAGAGSFTYGTYVATAGVFAFTPLPALGPKIGAHDPLTEAFVQTRFIPQAGRNNGATGNYPSLDATAWGFTNETNLETDAGTLTVQAAYRESAVHSVSTTSNFRGFFQDENNHQFTLEARFAGKIGTAVDYLVGAFLFDESIKVNSAINQITVLPIQNYDTGTNSKAAFGRLALHVTDTLTLTAAGRYTSDVKKFDGLSDVFTFNCGNPMAPPQDLCPTSPLLPLVRTAAEVIAFYGANGIPVGAPGVPPPAILNRARILRTQIAIPNAELETNKFTYRIAADWEITPSNLLYASYETGFHGGGFNFARGFETYAPESIRAVTIGSKNRFFDNKVQLNVEGFYWKYKDQQVASFGFDLSTPPISAFITSNVGRSTIKGFDVDLEVLATPTTRLSGNVQYLDTSYDSFITRTGATSPPSNVSQDFCSITTAGTVRTIDCSGAPALFSPKWSFNLGVEQTINFEGFKLVAAGRTSWRGDFQAATGYQPWTLSRAAFQSDASLTLAPDSDAWSVTAYVNNIENTRRITQSNANATLGTQSGLATPPRTYGIRIGGRF